MAIMDLPRRRFITQTAGALAGVALAPELSFALPRYLGEPRKLALIGAGRQGRAILDELHKIDAVVVAAVCDVVPARLNAASERLNRAEPFVDYRELLAKRTDIDAVIVTTSTHTHKEIAIAALNAGKHVYCEAPLAHTVEDARALAHAASLAKTVFQTGLLARTNPIYQRARSLVRSDSVRDVISIHAQNNRKTSWRFPSPDSAADRHVNWRLNPRLSIGLAGELGTHQFDVASWLRGKYPVRVTGFGAIRSNDDGREVHDTINVQLQWDDDVVMTYNATLGNSYGGAFEVVSGTNAAIRLAQTHGWMFKEADAATQGWEVYATRQQFYRDEGIVLVADATKLAAQGRLQEGAGLEHPPLYYALASFVRSVIEGAPVACTAADGERATIVGILAHRATVSGERVEISL